MEALYAALQHRLQLQHQATQQQQQQQQQQEQELASQVSAPQEQLERQAAGEGADPPATAQHDAGGGGGLASPNTYSAAAEAAAESGTSAGAVWAPAMDAAPGQGADRRRGPPLDPRDQLTPQACLDLMAGLAYLMQVRADGGQMGQMGGRWAYLMQVHAMPGLRPLDT